MKPSGAVIGRAPNPPPEYAWEMEYDEQGEVVFERDFRTISRYLVREGLATDPDDPLPVARLRPSVVGRPLANAYHASAMRFRYGLNHDRRGAGTSTEDVLNVLPKEVRDLMTLPPTDVTSPDGRPAASSEEADRLLGEAREDVLTATDDSVADERIAALQAVYRDAMVRELLPRMTGNAYDPYRHSELPREYQQVFARIVELQNDPLAYFTLVQQLEGLALRAQRREYLAGRAPLPDVEALVTAAVEARYGTEIDLASTDLYNGELVETMNTGVTIRYMQDVRRSGRPFLTPEFWGTGHSGLAHLLQDVVNYLHAAQNPQLFDGLPPERLEQMAGEVDSAHVDAMSEMYLDGFVNAANPNFWHVLMRYTTMCWQ